MVMPDIFRLLVYIGKILSILIGREENVSCCWQKYYLEAV